MGQDLLSENQVAPPSLVFNPPPVAPVAYMIKGLTGLMASSLTRPLVWEPFCMSVGPSKRHNEPMASGKRLRSASALVITWETAAGDGAWPYPTGVNTRPRIASGVTNNLFIY